MKHSRVIIIDDEKPARDLIRNFIERDERFEVIGEADNGYEGCLLINSQKPDLVFLDIQMPKINGIEMLDLLDKPLPYIVFSTAFDNYAVKAFEKNALDYLLKPYNKERFENAITKFIDQHGNQFEDHINSISPAEFSDKKQIFRIPVKYGPKVLILNIKEVLYLEAQDDYVKIVTKEGKYLKHSTMKYFEESLPKEIFVRIHRSYILNLEYLQQLETYDNANYLAVLKDASRLPVSRSGSRLLKMHLDIK